MPITQLYNLTYTVLNSLELSLSHNFTVVEGFDKGNGKFNALGNAVMIDGWKLVRFDIDSVRLGALDSHHLDVSNWCIDIKEATMAFRLVNRKFIVQVGGAENVANGSEATF